MEDINSLAERVIASQEKEHVKTPEVDFFNYDLPERDDLGMPTANSVEYVVARILYINYNITDQHIIHLREDGRVWEGEQWLAENSQNLYRITKWNYKPFNDGQKQMIWRRLREILPSLSYDKIAIKDNLIWDWKNNKLYFADENPVTVK